MSEVTRILDRVQQGNPKAGEELLPLVYEELRNLAAHRMANEAAGQTLQPTALVHEAWRRGWWQQTGRICLTLIATAAVGWTVWLHHWNLLGWHY